MDPLVMPENLLWGVCTIYIEYNTFVGHYHYINAVQNCFVVENSEEGIESTVELGKQTVHLTVDNINLEKRVSFP